MPLNNLWIPYYTMVRKDFVRIVRIWSQTLLPPIVTTSLYFVIFGKFIGSQIQPIQGYDYMQFIVPGLIMMSVITSSYMNTVSTFFFAKFIHNLDEITVSPTPTWVVIMGFMTGGVMRGIMVGVLVALTSLFFTHLAIYNIFVLVLALILTSILFSLAGLINGFFAKGFDGMSIVPTFVLTPLTYLGGVFYSVELLPEFWQKVSMLNPILYMVNAFRYGFLGISDINLWTCFAVLIGFTVVFTGIVAYMFRQGVGYKN